MSTTNFKLKPFVINLDDINYLYRQITFKPLFDVDGNALVNWSGIGPIYDGQGTQVWNGDGLDAAGAIAAYGTSYASTTASQGLRDVTGMNNNLNFAHAANRCPKI
jgi:hypothetical protein